MDESFNAVCTPPRITAEVDIARFLSAAGGLDRWRVSFAGQTHFLTDRATAMRIGALATLDGTASNYTDAWTRYHALAGSDAEPSDQFVSWCERHRDQLERLASTPDNHAIRFRRLILPGPLCASFTTPLARLFAPGTMMIVAAASVTALIAYLLLPHAAAGGSFWLAMALALSGVLVHETGHITACVRHRARQGGIGIGLYWIWPAFFADVRGSWSLSPRQRLQVSMGGLYFQSIYAAGLACVGLYTGSATITTALAITMLLMATTLNPVLKYDGYWILSDLLNVTNLHTRVASHLSGLLRPSAAGAPRSRRWTWVSLGFATAAAAYFIYVMVALAHAGWRTLGRLPTAWHDLSSVLAQQPSVDTSDHAAWECLSLGLQLLFIGFGLTVLGARSLRATADLFSAKESNS